MNTLLTITDLMESIGSLLALDALALLVLGLGIAYAILITIRGALRDRQVDILVRAELAEMQRLIDLDRK